LFLIEKNTEIVVTFSFASNSNFAKTHMEVERSISSILVEVMTLMEHPQR
jgi:hypothetical protein